MARETTSPVSHHDSIQALLVSQSLWNGPFAASGHMVQNPPCWRASYALGHPKQRKWKFVLIKSLCSGCPSGQLALQHGGFCTMWPLAAKGPLSLTSGFVQSIASTLHSSFMMPAWELLQWKMARKHTYRPTTFRLECICSREQNQQRFK